MQVSKQLALRKEMHLGNVVYMFNIPYVVGISLPHVKITMRHYTAIQTKYQHNSRSK